MNGKGVAERIHGLLEEFELNEKNGRFELLGSDSVHGGGREKRKR